MYNGNARFTNEQLRYFKMNFINVHSKMEEIFLIIAKSDNEQIALGEINAEAGISDFIRDKCIAALQLVGLIHRIEQGTTKIYKLTADGKNLKKLIMEGEFTNE